MLIAQLIAQIRAEMAEEILWSIREYLVDRATFEADMECPDGTWDEIELSEIEEWRREHKVHKEPGGDTLRCPRCLSTRVVIGELYGKCSACRYSVYLFDFPETSKFR